MSESPFGPDLRRALVVMVRRRVPDAEVEDIVQSALTEALQSPHAPKEPDALRKWVFGVAKNKVVDFHRRARKLSYDVPEVSGGPAPHDEADLLRWAERELPPGSDARRTLGWMLREGEGEKLESIAETENVPAPRVRQRVSRLRRHFKTRWAAEVAVLAALGVAITAFVLWFLRRPDPTAPITRDVPSAPVPSITPPPPPRAPENRPAGSTSAPAPVPSAAPSGSAAPAPSAAPSAWFPLPEPSIDLNGPKIPVEKKEGPRNVKPAPRPVSTEPLTKPTAAPPPVKPDGKSSTLDETPLPQQFTGKGIEPIGGSGSGGASKGGTKKMLGPTKQKAPSKPSFQGSF